MLVRVANKEDPDQTALQSDLVCTVCLGLIGMQLEFNLFNIYRTTWTHDVVMSH